MNLKQYLQWQCELSDDHELIFEQPLKSKETAKVLPFASSATVAATLSASAPAAVTADASKKIQDAYRPLSTTVPTPPAAGIKPLAVNPQAQELKALWNQMMQTQELDSFYNHFREFYRKHQPGQPPVVCGKGPIHSRLAVIHFGQGHSTQPMGFANANAQNLLKKMLGAIQIESNLCFMTLFVKSAQSPERLALKEKTMWEKVLQKELDLAKPEKILLLGSKNVRYLLADGRDFNTLGLTKSELWGIPCFCTYSPEELLLNEAQKRECWMHLKFLDGNK
jgi:uracil-DNA glycosylase family 4